MTFNIFKAYDVRGIYPDEFSESAAYQIGRAFAVFTKAKQIAIGQDMRLSSPQLVVNFAKGVNDQGADALLLGELSTDGLYFASGKLNIPAVMFTASHNPPQYNGIKFCAQGALPISSETGLIEIRKIAEANKWTEPVKKGKAQEQDVLADYTRHVLSFIDKSKIAPLKIAVDAGNGMAGKIVPLVFASLPCQILPLYFELDGSFPNHEANPIKPENIKDLLIKVKKEKADLGLAFDGDADRVFFVDEKGSRIPSSLITALVAEQMLKKNPKAKIIYNVPSSKIVAETIEKNNGEPIMERVGHSFIKETMRRTGAVFGGEHSGHYYFRDNFRADSGLIASLIVLEIISEMKKPFSEILKQFWKYFAIEEINFKVRDKKKVIDTLRNKYQDAKQDEQDGITFTYPEFWFNIRASNTEPVIRLNLEADTPELMKEKTKEISDIISNY